MFDYVKKKEFEEFKEFKEYVKEILGYLCDDKKLFETALMDLSKRINTLEEKLKQLEQENKELREENAELREFVEASLREILNDKVSRVAIVNIINKEREGREG